MRRVMRNRDFPRFWKNHVGFSYYAYRGVFIHITEDSLNLQFKVLTKEAE